MSSDADDISFQFDVQVKPDYFLPADWNISPTKSVYFVSESENHGNSRKLEIGSWGLVPSWSKDTSRSGNNINARIESINEKPSFKSAFKSRRCLVPANGYYEWSTKLGDFKQKQPFFISSQKDVILPMAGIYEKWANPQTKQQLVSISIITCESRGQIAEIHHRMPMIIPRAFWASWLSPKSLPEKQVNECINRLESHLSDLSLQAWPVSTAVNNPRNFGQKLTEPKVKSDLQLFY